jgi:hypothetical protein
MATYTVINGTEAQLTNVDGSSTNIDALSYKNGITLDSAHLTTLSGTLGVAVTSDLTSNTSAQQVKRVIGIAGMYAST